MSNIPTQINLNIRVAFQVVLQGISVRFGRSIVTVMGVALGIAFLMSILAGQVIKAGVSGEQSLRNETARMYNFFVAEAGLPSGVVLGLIRNGELNEIEQRLVSKIQAEKPREIREGVTAGEGATALILIGEGPLAAEDVEIQVSRMKHKLIFSTRKDRGLKVPEDLRYVVLERQQSEEELAEAAEDERKAGFRNIWIVVIALFVTVIGIANSMLMSVTERFREIGTMKCLGALSSFVRQMFLIESSLVGFVGAAAGALTGCVFSAVAYSFTYGFELVLQSMDPVRLVLYLMICVVVGIVLAVFAALYPARFASRMLPAHALRSDV